MKTINLLSSLLLLTFVIEIASAQTTFQKSLGGTGSDFGSVTQLTNDNGYIIVGTKNLGTGTDDIFLVRTNMNGDTLWTKTYGGSNAEYGNSVQQTLDGGFIVCGNTKSFGAGDKDVYLIRTDASGKIVWSRTFGGPGIEYGNSVQQTKDKGYIIGGSSSQLGAGAYDMYVIKTDSSGHALWKNTYGGAGYDDGNFVRQTKDEGYILTGTTSSFGGGGNDIFVVKTKANGDTLWTKTFGGAGEDYGFSVEETRDSGFIFTGTESSFGAGSYDSYLIRTDIAGKILWSKSYGGSDWDSGVSAQETDDHGFIVLGQSFTFGVESDVYLIKTNSTGDTLWTRIFGGDGYEFGGFVRQTKDGGYLISSGEESFGASRDMYLIKTDADGNSGCTQASTGTIVTSLSIPDNGIHTLVGSGGTESSPVTTFGRGTTIVTHCTTAGINNADGFPVELVASPNPFTDEVTLRGTKEKGKLVVFDLAGKEIMQAQSSDVETKMNLQQLLPGFYLLIYREKSKPANIIKLIKF